MKRFKVALVYVLALTVGIYVAYSMGAIAFFSTDKIELTPFAIPLGLTALASVVLTVCLPMHAKSIALCMALPMVCLAGLMQMGLAGEGRWLGIVGWLYLEAMVMGVALLAAGYTQKRMRQQPAG